jgi:hypothetical protein
MGTLITFIRFVLAVLGVAKAAEQEIHDGNQRDAGAAEQNVKDLTVQAGRETVGNKATGEVAGMADSELDKQLQGKDP